MATETVSYSLKEEFMILIMLIITFIAARVTRSVMKDVLSEGTDRLLFLIQIIAIVVLVIYIIVTIMGFLFVGAAN